MAPIVAPGSSAHLLLLDDDQVHGAVQDARGGAGGHGDADALGGGEVPVPPVTTRSMAPFTATWHAVMGARRGGGDDAAVPTPREVGRGLPLCTQILNVIRGIWRHVSRTPPNAPTARFSASFSDARRRVGAPGTAAPPPRTRRRGGNPRGGTRPSSRRAWSASVRRERSANEREEGGVSERGAARFGSGRRRGETERGEVRCQHLRSAVRPREGTPRDPKASWREPPMLVIRRGRPGRKTGRGAENECDAFCFHLSGARGGVKPSGVRD